MSQGQVRDAALENLEAKVTSLGKELREKDELMASITQQ